MGNEHSHHAEKDASTTSTFKGGHQESKLKTPTTSGGGTPLPKKCGKKKSDRALLKLGGRGGSPDQVSGKKDHSTISTSSTAMKPRGGKSDISQISETSVMHEITKKNSKTDSTEHGSKRLEEQPYFHGRLPREEAAEILREQGDFLVRESVNTNQDQPVVISVFWNGTLRHYPITHEINSNKEFKWRLGVASFSSVSELIYYYYRGQRAIKDDVRLLTPIPKDKYQLNNDDIELLEKLGSGAFGDVWKGKLKHSTGTSQEVAVKQCRDSESLSADQKKKFLQEARIMKRYDHPNVLSLVGVCITKDPIMIVTELLWMGMDTYFEKYRGQTTIVEMTKFSVDVAAGMAYLASRNCIHRDLAARNCLLTKEKVVKVSDFGLSREGSNYVISAFRGHKPDSLSTNDLAKQRLPVRWCAPEALTHWQFTTKSDVWSFGVLMYEIFTEGAIPYSELENMDVAKLVSEGTSRLHPPSNMTDHLKIMMKYCLEHEPKKRPSFRELHDKLSKELTEISGKPVAKSAERLTQRTDTEKTQGISTSPRIPVALKN